MVGAGVGGLASAARLAALGHEVTVLEAAERLGGKLGTYERDGYVFDTGPSLVTMPQVFADLFDATGTPLGDTVELERLDVACRYTFPDGKTEDAAVVGSFWLLRHLSSGPAATGVPTTRIRVRLVSASGAVVNDFRLAWGTQTCAQISHGC